jgi:hypothetical protein
MHRTLMPGSCLFCIDFSAHCWVPPSPNGRVPHHTHTNFFSCFLLLLLHRVSSRRLQAVAQDRACATPPLYNALLVSPSGLTRTFGPNARFHVHRSNLISSQPTARAHQTAPHNERLSQPLPHRAHTSDSPKKQYTRRCRPIATAARHLRRFSLSYCSRCTHCGPPPLSPSRRIRNPPTRL